MVDRGAALDRRLALRPDPTVPVEVERVEFGERGRGGRTPVYIAAAIATEAIAWVVREVGEFSAAPAVIDGVAC
jgi:hypothetical protein